MGDLILESLLPRRIGEQRKLLASPLGSAAAPAAFSDLKPTLSADRSIGGLPMGGASIAAAAEAGGDQRSGWGAWRICYPAATM